jgi:KDO2-lipid IV(A) lauroyltransferase
MSDARPFSRRLRYALETVLVYVLYLFFRLLPIRAASACGGMICRTLGPHLPSSETARRNLARVFPEKSAEEREKIVAASWDNLGRTLAEYAHLHHIWDYVELEGAEHLATARACGKAPIFFAAHLANWEICAICVKRAGLEVYPVYRRPNNPGVEGLLRHARGTGATGLIAKGAAGAREMLAVLKNKGALGIMMDQKLNEGMAIPFFGRPAMTAPAIASFALRFQSPVYPVQIERLGGVRFKITIHPPLSLTPSGDKEQDTRAILTEINRQFENWIRKRPEQWLWIHRRWPD